MTNRTSSKPPLTVDEAISPKAEEPSTIVRAWQDEEVRKAIKEADSGDFVTAQELKATVRRFLRDG